MKPKRRLVICADDFAMSEGVSRTIVDLARDGKVNAISCMAISPRWPKDVELLSSLPGGVQIGLHLVLTDEQPLTSMPRLTAGGHLPSCEALTRKALLRRLPLDEINDEVAAQFDRFEKYLGRPPAFVDGHQHTHLLAGIRDIVIAQTAARAPSAWLRTCEDRAWRILNRPFATKGLINSAQSKALGSAARRLGLRCNDGFSGLYNFRASFAELFPRFLAKPGEFHLLICHPGALDTERDPIGDARVREAEALKLAPVTELAAAAGLSFP